MLHDITDACQKNVGVLKCDDGAPSQYTRNICRESILGHHFFVQCQHQKHEKWTCVENRIAHIFCSKLRFQTFRIELEVPPTKECWISQRWRHLWEGNSAEWWFSPWSLQNNSQKSNLCERSAWIPRGRMGGVSEVHADCALPQTPSQRTRPKRGWACSVRLAATTWRQAPP